MALDEEFKNFLLQQHVGTLVTVQFSPKGDVVDDKCSLFVEACDSDCITLVQHPTKKRRRQKAGPVKPVTEKRSHIPLDAVLVVTNASGVVLYFDRWWWENDF